MLSLAFPLFKKGPGRDKKPLFVPSKYIEDKVGGHAIIPESLCHLFNDNLLACPSCKTHLFLLLQICTPFMDDDFDRMLFVFMCNSFSCMHCRAIISFVRKPKTGTAPAAKPPTNTCMFDPFVLSGDENMTEVAKLSFERMTIYSKPDDAEDGDSENVHPSVVVRIPKCPLPPFPIEFVDQGEGDPVHEEDDKKGDRGADISHLNTDLVSEIPDEEVDPTGESYEQVIPHSMDEAFYKFEKQISKDPWQVVRYEWQGSPLLPSSAAQSQVPPCSICGSPRVFELQLMPSMIHLLKTELHAPKGDNQKQSWSDPSDGMEWSTVLVYSCEEDCQWKRTKDKKPVSCPELTFSHTVVQNEQDN